ncbi:MAG: hypothetical protein ACI9G1_005897 [Pirellulaceae bacterium]|jgi:hypothetical protein
MNRVFTCLAVSFFALPQFALPQFARSAEDEEKPEVSLVLNSVVALSDNTETLFKCNATLINNTDSDIIVTSNFSSVFDIVTIVVITADGKQSKQQSYIYHQSPFTSDGRDLKLKRGETKADLVFPIEEFGRNGETVKVQLVGVAIVSGDEVALSSKTKKIVIKKKM